MAIIAPIPTPDSGMTDAQIIDALLTRLTSTDHISALAHEVKLKAEADESIDTLDGDALSARLEALIRWVYDRQQPE
jgi:hypothetical protein